MAGRPQLTRCPLCAHDHLVYQFTHESTPIVRPETHEDEVPDAGLELFDKPGSETFKEALTERTEVELPEFSFDLGGIDLDSIPVGTDEFKPLEPLPERPVQTGAPAVESGLDFVGFEAPVPVSEQPLAPAEIAAPVEPESVESIDMFGSDAGDGAESFDIDQIMADARSVSGNASRIAAAALRVP